MKFRPLKSPPKCEVRESFTDTVIAQILVAASSGVGDGGSAGCD